MPRCFARMEKALSETEVNHGVPCDATEKTIKKSFEAISQFVQGERRRCLDRLLPQMWNHLDSGELKRQLFKMILIYREDDDAICSGNGLEYNARC